MSSTEETRESNSTVILINASVCVYEERWFWQSVQRAPAHAILTSRHKETIECLVQIGRDEFDLDLLAEQSSTGKTALHVAAEANDVESVQILLQL